MRVKLAFEDWRQTGQADSIYETPLGVELSLGDLHSGTTFEATVVFDSIGIEGEIEVAYKEDGAYPVFRMVPADEVKS